MSYAFEQALTKKYGKFKKTRGRRGTEYKICCPFCASKRGKPDKSYKLYVNPSLGVYNCYKCEARGRASDLVGAFANVPPPPRTVRPPSRVSMPGEVVPLHTLGEDHIARRYLEMRGFNTELLSTHLGVHYCVQGQVFGNGVDFAFDTTNTIVFPVWMHGKLIGWQARLLYDPDSLSDEQCALYGFPQDEDGKWIRPPKYYTPSGMAKGEILYNFDNAVKSDLVVVSEGPLDVAGIGMCGVGTFGKSISDDQIRLLKEYWDIVVLMLDPGDADAETERLFYDLQMSVITIPVTLSKVKDPGDASFYRIWSDINETALNYDIDISRYNLAAFKDAIIRTNDNTKE